MALNYSDVERIRFQVLLVLAGIASVLITMWRTISIVQNLNNGLEENNSFFVVAKSEYGKIKSEIIKNLAKRDGSYPFKTIIEYLAKFNIKRNKIFSIRLEFAENIDGCYIQHGILFMPNPPNNDLQKMSLYVTSRILSHMFVDLREILLEEIPDEYNIIKNFFASKLLPANVFHQLRKSDGTVDRFMIISRDYVVNIAKLYDNLRIFPILKMLTELDLSDPHIKEKIREISKGMREDLDYGYKHFLFPHCKSMILNVGNVKKVRKQNKKLENRILESTYGKSIQKAISHGIKTIYIITYGSEQIEFSKKLVTSYSKNTIFEEYIEIFNDKPAYFAELKF